MRLSFNSLLAITALTTVSAPAFAQFATDPITGTVGAQTLSSGTGTVSSSGIISTSGSTVAVAFSGTSKLVNNGTIRQTGSGRAIDSNSTVSDLTVINNGTISAVSSDAFRVNTNSAVSLDNFGLIQVTAGGQAIDWAAITSKTNVLTNEATGVIKAVGEDAVRPGTNGLVTNYGTIMATPTATTSNGLPDVTGSDGIDVRTFTGIQVNNYGSISGRHGIATDGTNVGPSTISVHNFAGGTISAINGSGLNIDGAFAIVTANVTNDFGGAFKGGVLSTVANGDGDGIDVDGVLTLTNGGDVLGLGARGAGNNAEGIAAGGGTITNLATGRIVGSSLLADAPNGEAGHAGNGILIDNSSNGPAVAVTTITNDGLIQGKNGVGVQIVGTFADTITNNASGTIQGTGTSAVIQMGGGADTLINRGAIISDTANGSAIDLQDGNDQLTIEGGSASVVGNISGGTGSNAMKIAPGTGQSFAYAGSISNFDTVEVASGTVTLSGLNAYTGKTLVSGGRLVLDGANRIAAASVLALSGGTLALAHVGAANGQTFAGLELNDSSTIDLGSTTSLTFGTLSFTQDASKSLTVVDWNAGLSPDYAIRFLGDLTSSAAFAWLMNQTTVNGYAAAFDFDGEYTNVHAVPVPAALGLMMSGLGLLGAFRRRRATA